MGAGGRPVKIIGVHLEDEDVCGVMTSQEKHATLPMITVTRCMESSSHRGPHYRNTQKVEVRISGLDREGTLEP